MSSTRRSRRAMAQMNVVPYIDVMLVLLVIFMVTAPMMQSGVEVNAPDTAAKPLSSDNQQEPLIIYVDQTGQYFLSDGKKMAASEVTDYVATHLDDKRDRQVYIKGDAAVEYRYLFAAMVAVQEAGAKKIGLLNDASKTKARQR
ncbi:ExbD/TolR family protein [Thiolinea disciformis]|uniref:ExbD/TolR family protein n=1 Tax=Thiolinea disciformis TaxID=125614 RepID=UPI000379CB55|nr:ExbD/TolR family protein [Thiolinea disciformis]